MQTYPVITWAKLCEIIFWEYDFTGGQNSAFTTDFGWTINKYFIIFIMQIIFYYNLLLLIFDYNLLLPCFKGTMTYSDCMTMHNQICILLFGSSQHRHQSSVLHVYTYSCSVVCYKQSCNIVQYKRRNVEECQVIICCESSWWLVTQTCCPSVHGSTARTQW